MGNFQIIQLKNQKYAFIDAAHIVNYMNKYSRYMGELDRTILDFFIKCSSGLPLPSGRWGNAIALALEINDYIVAEYLINNSERLMLDTDTVVSELGGKNAWSLKDEYLFSQLTYEEEILPIREGETEEDYKKYVDYMNRIKLANERLEAKLSITSEDKKLLNQKK